MITFKSTEDFTKISPTNPIYPTIQKLVLSVLTKHPEYVPEEDGYLALVEPGDADRVLDDLDLPLQLSEVPFEGVSKIDGFYHAVYLPNNQFALSFLIPDAEWLPDDLRRHLEAHF